MSTKIPTYRQWQEIVASEIEDRHPGIRRDDPEGFWMTVGANTDITTYPKLLAADIEEGHTISLSVLDTLSPAELYDLRKHYAPRGSLDSYIPRPIRTAPKTIYRGRRRS